ncbi:MAG: PHP domain-containing protein [Paraglaciecola sp.]|uniref:PHP domain-containing protein n=1 Tax=Paraglaciecola sp. TaxID=1920173 RepID=UPI00273D5A80|nr:PHP domain-containing protein [Paraglaciecola sp.]MDP5032539.1 PHP domain-containing protein [Paraglaciecola sp.]MDP5133773.1 PHP domain-containing protein [Paraglaciecola sp.]
MKIDLHSHTYYSDGQLSPKELIDRAHNMQVNVLAITDHDTVDGINEALDYQASLRREMQIMPGVEISTSWHNFDIHILGLHVNHGDTQFLARLAQQSAERDRRAQEISDKLAKVGIAGVFEQAKELAGVGQITRAHFARVLVNRQLVNDMEAAFKKYLGKGKKAHVKPQWISIQEAVTWIQDAGGKAVLAHPGHYDLTTKWLKRLVAEFAQVGGDGMEVIHSHLSPEKKKLLADLASEHDLLASSGSDFHYPNRWTELGKNLTLPSTLVPIWRDWNLSGMI